MPTKTRVCGALTDLRGLMVLFIGTGGRGVLRRSAQVLIEPVQRVLPRLLCGGFVVTGSRIVVETVIGASIDMTFVRHLGSR